MKEYGKTDKGFTLIELIIVIAIIAALIGILTPQYLKYVEKSRSVTCMSNRDNAVKAYGVEKIDQNGRSEQELMDDVMAGMGATKTASGYKGVCPSGGIVTFEVSADGELTLYCTKHENISSPSLASQIMTGITSIWNKSARGTSLLAYLKKNGSHIDSNFPADLSNSNSSWVAYVESNLTGIDYSSQTWCLSSDGKTITFKITTGGSVAEAGKSADVLVYTYDTNGNFVSGPTASTASVTNTTSSGNTYLTLR